MAQLFPDEETEIKANEMVVVQHELSHLDVLIDELKQYEELADNKGYQIYGYWDDGTSQIEVVLTVPTLTLPDKSYWSYNADMHELSWGNEDWDYYEIDYKSDLRKATFYT